MTSPRDGGPSYNINNPIKTYCHNPPIPVRNWDWCAFRDGDEEDATLIAWGPTEELALLALKELEAERAESESL